MVLEEMKEENEIILDLEEKKAKSKPTLEVVLSILSKTHLYAFHCLNLGIKVNITKQALVSFSVSKFVKLYLLDHGCLIIMRVIMSMTPTNTKDRH